MNKKIITVLLAGMVAMTVLTGCGKKEDNTAVPTPKATATPTTVTETPVQTPAVTGSASEAKVTLGQYKGLTLHEVDSEVIQKELHDMMQEYAELVVVDRAAKEGDTVKAGDLIGHVGNTGNSARDHLHLTIVAPDGFYVNPAINKWKFERDGKIIILECDMVTGEVTEKKGI